MAFNIVAGVNNAVYGSVSGSGSYEENSEVTLEVTVNDGYRFVQWDDGNTDNPRVFNVTEDVTLVATLEAIPEYAVTLTENNSNLGNTSGSGNYLEGSTATISATPTLHCRFVKWDDDNTDNPRTLTVNSAITLEAIFETVNWYTISTSVNDATMGSVTGAGDYDEGDIVTLTAIANTDYKFVMWRDENTDNPRTFTASASGSYEAVFAEIVYADVTIASNDTELGTVSGATSGNIETGSSITLTATPATDCKFDGWQIDGEMLEDTSTTITLTVAENEMDVIAVFSAIVFYQVNLLSSDTDCGHITVVSQTAEPRGVNNNIWAEGTVLELRAICEEGGNFLNWGDGDRETSKIITVFRNETIRANFYPSTGLILVTKKILNQTWTTIKNFFAAPTGASKIGAPANNALGATTLADVVNSVGQPDGIALLNASGKVAAADIDGTLTNDTTGNAATATVATKVGTTTVGASDTPIYLNAGTATACGTSLAVDITGNAATATTAAACSGNAATATTAAACSGNAATATTATNVLQEYGTANYNRPILLSKLENITTTTAQNKNAVFSNKFYANPSTGVMYSTGGFNGALTGNVTGNCSGSSGSCTGNAATATTATNANNAKLTHTVGNSEYPLVFGTSFVITDAQQALRIGTPTATAANCALRCKSYCAAANTQGEAYLVCGNNIAKASANNARGSIYLYGTNDSNTRIIPSDTSANVTITLPASTGTLALTSSNITGNAANVTGTVAIANGGTGATTRLNALKALTNESVGTNATYFLTITNSWGKGGYTSVADAKKVLGIDGSIPIYYVQGPSTDTTAGTWTGSITGLTAYYDGLTILYVPAVAGASATTLNINSLGAKTCYYTNTSALTTHYSVGTPILLTYRDNAWRRADYNSNTTYSAMSVSEGTTGTATTSRTMRADYLKQIIAALPSASCTGDCGGTATYSTNSKLTHTVGNTEYPLVFGTSFVTTDAQQALRIGTPSATSSHCPLRVKAYCAAADTQGEAYLVLGNALATASANNSRGGLVMYGTGTAYNFIKMNTVNTNAKTIFLNTANSGDITLTLPAITGRVVVSSDSTPVVDIKVVSSLPASPVANTIYLVK